MSSRFKIYIWHIKAYVAAFAYAKKLNIYSPDFYPLKFTKYNQYESLILPTVKYLEAHGVQFQYDIMVISVIFDIKGQKVAAKIICLHDGNEECIDLNVI